MLNYQKNGEKYSLVFFMLRLPPAFSPSITAFRDVEFYHHHIHGLQLAYLKRIEEFLLLQRQKLLTLFSRNRIISEKRSSTLLKCLRVCFSNRSLEAEMPCRFWYCYTVAPTRKPDRQVALSEVEIHGGESI